MTRTLGAAALTIDVDAVRHYHAIHGLPPPHGEDPIVSLGVRRFLDMCTRMGVRATVFVVTSDVVGDSSGGYADLLRQVQRAGHELASHSHGHAYDLSRRSPAEIQSDVLRSAEVLEDLLRARPRGFRAPGYNLSEDLLDAVERAGFAYDSSVMPSPAYFAARASAIVMHRLGGRTSSSLVGDARAFMGPRGPYLPRRGAAHARARSRVEARALVEVPISSLPLGLPWLGTTLSMTPLPLAVLSTALTDSAARTRPVVLELHAIDFCCADDGFDDALVRLQPDLRVPLHKRLGRIEAAVRVLAQTRQVMPLDELVAALDPRTLVGRAPVIAPRETG